MGRTAAAHQLECLVGALLLNVIAKVAIGYEKYLVAVQLFHYLYSA